MDELIQLVSKGEINLCGKTLEKLTEIDSKIDVLNQLSDQLQDKWTKLDIAIKNYDRELEELKQYIKLDNLLFHNFPQPPTSLTSLGFSCYMADMINFYFPYLPFPVRWDHISDAHPLRTKSNKSNVVIVRFANRNIRHEIYSQRYSLPRNMSITEHFTKDNLSVIYRAKELFGYENYYTEKCKIYVNVNDKSICVKTINDVNEAFETTITQAENSNINYSATTQRNYKQKSTNSNNTFHHRSFTYRKSYSNVVQNHNSTVSNHTNNNMKISHVQTSQGHGRKYRGQKPSSGYSVYNRSY